jgi:hypothetical protein
MIFFTILVLATLYPIEKSIGQLPMEAAPTLSLPGGYYDQDIQLKISAPSSSGSQSSHVIFTVDGSIPTHTVGTVYTQPLHLSAATPAVTVIRARAISADGELGPVISASYFVGVQAQLPMISLIIDPYDLWNPAHGIYVNFDQRGRAWERPVDITYVDRDRRSGFHAPAGVRIHGAGSRSFDKKSLRLYFRQEYGTSQLEYPLFANSEVQSFKRLILHNGGQDMHVPLRENWTLTRNQLANDLALQLGGYATHTQPALMFINGELWGIYQIRERIDERFLADHYGVTSADLLESPESDLQAIVTGDSEHWDHLLQFVETHDLAEPDNYAYIQSQIDVANFVDYNILQIYAVNTNWPYHNVYQFRPRVQGGRWHWIFWDTDHGFGLNPRGHVHSNLIEYLLDYNHPETGGRDVLLLRQLLKNPVFLERFLSRAADLLNTTLSPQSVIARIDALAVELAPDITYEITRWSSPTNWESSVEELREFACLRPDFVRQHMVERFNLSGAARLALGAPLNGPGSVAVNGFLLPDLPWQGIYFQDVPIQVMAAPAPGYQFAGWDPPHLPQTPALTLTIHTALTITPRFEPLASDAPHPDDVVFGAIGRDQLELQVTRPDGVDLRGWRITDNDTKTATDEGSLILTDDPAFAHVPAGTTILIVLTPSRTQPDDLDAWDRQMILYVGNGNLDADADPGFNLATNDALALLAPGPTRAFHDDQGIAFVARSAAVTPASFGVLSDGVLPAH